MVLTIPLSMEFPMAQTIQKSLRLYIVQGHRSCFQNAQSTRSTLLTEHMNLWDRLWEACLLYSQQCFYRSISCIVFSCLNQHFVFFSPETSGLMQLYSKLPQFSRSILIYSNLLCTFFKCMNGIRHIPVSFFQSNCLLLLPILAKELL